MDLLVCVSGVMMYSKKTPWDDFDGKGYMDRGDPLIIYYNNTQWPETIITSRRWEAFREGLEDYTYLYLLNKAIKKAKEKGIDVSKGEHLLNQFNYEVYYDKDPDTLYRFMDNVREETVRLNKLIPFTVKPPEAKVKDNDVTIHWESSQPCMGEVYYLKKRKKREERFAEIWVKIGSSSKSTTDHSVTLKDLAPEYKFLFYTSSTNGLGYMAVDNNKGKFYQFETQ